MGGKRGRKTRAKMGEGKWGGGGEVCEETEKKGGEGGMVRVELTRGREVDGWMMKWSGEVEL